MNVGESYNPIPSFSKYLFNAFWSPKELITSNFSFSNAFLEALRAIKKAFSFLVASPPANSFTILFNSDSVTAAPDLSFKTTFWNVASLALNILPSVLVIGLLPPKKPTPGKSPPLPALANFWIYYSKSLNALSVFDIFLSSKAFLILPASSDES